MRKTWTVKDLAKYARENELKLLSGFGGQEDPLSAFWGDYKSFYQSYDRSFNRMFANFEIYIPWLYYEDTSTVAEAYTEFAQSVEDLLRLNEKRYAELYRMHVIPDADYSLTNNYDMQETGSIQRQRDHTDTYGSRTDSAETKIAGFNSSDYSDSGKTESTTGQQQDHHTGGDGESTSLHRVGNIGVMTVSDMLEKHVGLWERHQFFEMIFFDIARELLFVGDCD